MRTLLAGYRVEVPALTPAGHALELRSLRGPAWTDILVSREKDQSLRTEWAYIRRFARRWRSCPPCLCPCLRRGHRSLFGSPPPASWCLSACCCLPVVPNPVAFAAVRSIERLPLLGGEATLAPIPAVVAPPLAGSSCRPSLSVAALSRWAEFPWWASSNEVLAKGNVVGNSSLRQWKAIALSRGVGLPLAPRHY